MKELEKAQAALQAELTRIMQSLTDKAAAIDRQAAENQREIEAATAEMEEAIMSDDIDRYTAAAQRKAIAEERTGYFESLREKLRQKQTAFIEPAKARQLWEDYTAALRQLHRAAGARMEELTRQELEESRRACGASDEWFALYRKWCDIVGPVGLDNCPAYMPPPRAVAMPYRKAEQLHRAGVKQEG